MIQRVDGSIEMHTLMSLSLSSTPRVRRNKNMPVDKVSEVLSETFINTLIATGFRI